MLAILLCFASTLFAMQFIVLVVIFAFVLFYWKAMFAGYSGRGGGVLLMILLVMQLSMPLNVWRNPSTLAYILVEIVVIALAFVFVSNKESYWRASRIVLIVSQALVIIYLAQVGLTDFPLDNMIPGASSNAVTSYLILLQCNYSITRFFSTQKVSLYTSAVTVAICIVGFGRGSLVASLGLFALNAFYLPRQWRLFGHWWPVFTVLCLIFYFLPNLDAILNYLEANTKLGAGLVDDHRTSILNAYFGKLDSWSLIWGADYSGTNINEEYNGNPHNSFIRAHHLYGFLYLLVIFYFVIWSLIGKSYFSLRIYGVFVLMILLSRAFTEPILFPTLLDVFFFSMCLMLDRLRKD
jgi:hypothetical protein